MLLKPVTVQDGYVVRALMVVQYVPVESIRRKLDDKHMRPSKIER